MNTELELAFSPCPNDTFIFHHLLKAGTQNLSFQPTYLDVAELNHRAMESQSHHISKLSFFAMSKLRDKYRLLDCGGALGRGCGPLWITNRAQSNKEALKEVSRILIPGPYTTANLLTNLYLADQKIDRSRIEFVPMRYDLIMPALKNGDAEYGILIHEERFTYEDEGLFKILDLGEWWESSTGHPIPLGCIAARKDLSDPFFIEIEDGIRSSVEYAFKHPTEALPFIKEHSQSLKDEVVQSHINLYVNDYSLSYGEEGHAAIEELFKRATTL